MPISSKDIAQVNTYTKDDFEWRNAFCKGMIVDAMDRNSNWFQGVVVEPEQRVMPIMPMVKIGFRQYSSHGDKIDDMGNYFGLSS